MFPGSNRWAERRRPIVVYPASFCQVTTSYLLLWAHEGGNVGSVDQRVQLLRQKSGDDKSGVSGYAAHLMNS